MSERQVTRSCCVRICGIGHRADYMCWEQTLWNGDQTCMMSGRPAESLEPFAVEMRRQLSTDMHRAAPFTVHAGRESYTGGMDKSVRSDSHRMTLAHPLLPTLCSPLSSLSTSSSNSPSRISPNNHQCHFDRVFPALPETDLPIEHKGG